MAKKIVRRKLEPSLALNSVKSKKFNLNLSKLLNLLKKLNSTQALVLLLIVAAFLIGVLFTKVQYLEKGAGTPSLPSAQTGTQPQQPGLQAGQKVDVKAGKLPILGKDSAKVTVIEFADFQCPFCGRWFKETGTNLIKEYVDTGKVKFAYRHFAFLGDESNWSAEASNCANEQGKFWLFHDYLFNNQSGENQGAFTKDKLKGFAATLGLNTSQFNTCLDSGKYTKDVADDTQAGQTAGVSGTPTVFINGVAIVGAQPYSVFKAAIDAELAK